jgi:hypothetical protein
LEQKLRITGEGWNKYVNTYMIHPVSEFNVMKETAFNIVSCAKGRVSEILCLVAAHDVAEM